MNGWTRTLVKRVLKAGDGKVRRRLLICRRYPVIIGSQATANELDCGRRREGLVIVATVPDGPGNTKQGGPSAIQILIPV